MNSNPSQLLLAANKLQSEGQSAQAEIAFRAIIKNRPDFHPAYHALGLLALNAGKLDVATKLMDSAITLEAQNAIYYRDCGEIYRRLGRTDEAINRAERAIELAPENAAGHYNLGLALADSDQKQAALASYRRALSIDPGHGLALNNMGSILESLDQIEAAESAFREAIAINSQHAEAQNNLGCLLSKRGLIEEARSCLEQAVNADPMSVSAHFNLAPLKHYMPNDPHLKALDKLGRQRKRFEIADQTQLLFTLGKACDDIGDYERAFAAYAQGNQLKRQSLPANRVHNDRLVASVLERFTPAFLAEHAGAGIDDPAPVFIVGMPRSGTSLIEQILASHHAAHGAGELKDFHDIAEATLGKSTNTPYPEQLGDFSAEVAAELGNRYLEKLHRYAPAAERITDKMPANFHYLGLIYLALPNARIIHSMRDPMGSCLSCYTKLFKDTMEFAYDLGTLGEYYVRYEKLMAHWHNVLPAEFILDVHYEDMVSDMEGETRKILAHIGLPWDANCLDFYKTSRPVKTASLAQVRKPIYNSSIDNWKRFESQLAPLLEIVADYR
jgi:tetratricopeptide (TPR) repeat protein